MARITWTDDAIEDLEEITAFIARDSAIYARRIGRQIRQAPKPLKRFPRLGPMVPEFEQDNLRELLVGMYRLIYEIRGKACNILAVVHSSRDLTRIMSPPQGDF